MTRKGGQEILKEALLLSESERDRIAAELLTSLGPVESRPDDAWITEIERRANAVIEAVPGLTWDETRKRVEERLASIRKGRRSRRKGRLRADSRS